MSLAYYEVAAQVIPTLLIALIFEQHFFRRKPQTTEQAGSQTSSVEALVQALSKRVPARFRAKANDSLVWVGDRAINLVYDSRGGFNLAVVLSLATGEAVAFAVLFMRKPSQSAQIVVSLALIVAVLLIIAPVALHELRKRGTLLGFFVIAAICSGVLLAVLAFIAPAPRTKLVGVVTPLTGVNEYAKARTASNVLAVIPYGFHVTFRGYCTGQKVAGNPVWFIVAGDGGGYLSSAAIRATASSFKKPKSCK